MSLYRKYRPQTFEDVVGQEHVAQTLRNALTAVPPRVAHAYLLCGPRGTGKTTNARLLAKCLNCEQGPTPTPCNKCDFCVRVMNNETHMDLLEIDAASNTQVEKVREFIIANLSSKPTTGKYRVYIIDEVHMLSPSSFAALLKSIEEPPSHAVFILATTDTHKVPPTVVSRCQQFTFRRIGPKDIAARLHYVAEKEGIALEDGAARLIAHAADGALRDSLTLLEQVTAFSSETVSESDVRLVLGTISHDLLLELMDAVSNGEPLAALAGLDRATEDGVAVPQLTRDLVSYARDLLLLTVGFNGDADLGDGEMQRRAHHARILGRTRLTNFIEALREAEKEMKSSNDHRLLLELVLVRAATGELDAQAAPQIAAPKAAAPRPTPAAQNGVAQNGNVQAAPVAMPQVQTPRAVQTTQDETGSTVEFDLTPSKAIAPETVESNGSAQQNGAASTVEFDRTPSPESAPEVAANNGSAPENEIQRTVENDRTVSPVSHEPQSEIHNPQAAIPETSNPESSRQKGRRIHTMEEFVELWPAVLVRVRRKIGVTAVAYLHDALPCELTDTQAVLQFKKEFHYEKACEAAKRLPFEQVLNECMATPRVLKFRHTPPPKKQAIVEEAPPESTPAEDEAFEDDVLKYAQNIFAAQIVGRSGEG